MKGYNDGEVWVDDISGDLQALVGSPIIIANEKSNVVQSSHP